MSDGQVAATLVEMVKRVIKKQHEMSQRLADANNQASAAALRTDAIGGAVTRFCQSWNPALFLPA